MFIMRIYFFQVKTKIRPYFFSKLCFFIAHFLLTFYLFNIQHRKFMLTTDNWNFCFRTDFIKFLFQILIRLIKCNPYLRIWSYNLTSTLNFLLYSLVNCTLRSNTKYLTFYFSIKSYWNIWHKEKNIDRCPSTFTVKISWIWPRMRGWTLN